MPAAVARPYAACDVNTGSDTIAALSSAAGEAGIAVVRVSGPDSLVIADALFEGGSQRPSAYEGGTFLHGHVRAAEDADNVAADEVILLIYRSPRSYTREDVVEFQGHGGRQAAARVLRAVLQAGARMAEPGEFTRRAFLNGRIDLLQAEAVMDLIRARSDRAAAVAVEQLDGILSNSLNVLYDNMANAAADLEASLDFEEQELPETVMPMIRHSLAEVGKGLEELLRTWGEGRLLREGASVVISGRPNVGKSTLLNRLLGVERAIVTDTPGTTRDTIEEQIVIEGVPLRLVDTAGLRDAECHIEQEGVRRAHNSAREADIVLYVVDGSTALGPEDRKALDAADRDRTIVVLNKSDLGQCVHDKDLPGLRSVVTSFKIGTGLDDLRAALLSTLGLQPDTPPHPVISERHRASVQSSLNFLNEARDLLSSDRGEFLVPAVDMLREALEELGVITGRTYTADVLDRIFSRFCIGK